MMARALQWRPLLAATLGITVGVLAVLQTPGMSELGRVFPMTAGLIAIAAGICVLIQTFLRPAPMPAEDGTDLWRGGLLAGTLLAGALLLGTLGFVAVSAIALPVIAIITRRERMTIRSVAAHSTAGVVLVVGFALLLSEVLNVRLP